MFTTIRIKNLALVAELCLEFSPGYNSLTGETGAGKSVIIGALQLLVGERADRSLIRSGADSCSVEAVVEVSRVSSKVAALLEASGLEPCEGDQLLLRRVITAAGANKQFINGSAATLQTLSDLGDLIVDFHGPHEHQSLLNPLRQLDLVDAHAGAWPLRSQFAVLVAERAQTQRQLIELAGDERDQAQRIDLLRFQANEIEAARLVPGEETELDEEYQRLSNAARLQELSQAALQILNEEESNLLQLSGGLGRLLQELQRLDPTAAHLGTQQQQASEMLRDLLSDLSRYADSVELNPERLAEVQARLDLMHTLKRKYGPSLEDVVAFGKQARSQLALLEDRDGEVERLRQAAERLDRELGRLGKELSVCRSKSLARMAKAIEAELAALGFRQSRFSVELSALERKSTDVRWHSSGLDEVEFLFSPNPGEPQRPLRAIASSGEMARVMLAIKTVLAKEDETPVLVFDEVDANVGGETAYSVGRKMRQIGEGHQVLCITHLAPVAAAADHHFVVSKDVRDGRTFSDVRRLADEERVRELARMLGGQGEAAIQHARSLLLPTP